MQLPAQKNQSKYRPDIDGLRAIAIISVVFYHAGFPGFSGGFVGVDVFFVISGFLITSLLFSEAVATGRVSLSAFYARRVRRLMPAGVVVVAATLLLGGLFMLPASDEQRSLARSAMAVAFFGSNFYFFTKTGGYFDAPSFSMPLLHTWSLAIEEQYYLIWPLLMLLLFRISRVPATEFTMRKRVLWALSVMGLASLALCIVMTPSHQNFSFFLLPARVWEFAIGGIVGLLGATFYGRLRWMAESLSVIGLALIVISVLALSHGTPFPGWAAIMPVFGSAVLIVGMTADEHGVIRRLLASRPMVFIGLLSYSWYLWHWPLLSLYRNYNLGAHDVVADGVVISLALALAWLTFVCIERPIRINRPWLFGKIRSTLFAGAGLALLTLLMGMSLFVWRNYQANSKAYRTIKAARTDIPPYQKQCMLSGSLPAELPRGKCTHGADPQHPKILLWGDSHADQMMPMLIEAFPDIAVYQLTMTGCVPVIGYESHGMPGTLKECPEFNRRTLQEISDLKKNGLEGVVISARWESYLWHQSISLAELLPGMKQVDAKKMAQERTDMQSYFDTTLSSLERIGVRVVVLAPTPSLVYSAPQCVVTRGESYCNVPRPVVENMLADATTALEEVVVRHPNTRLVQLMDYFCDAQTCYAARDGQILFMDDDHITATTARNLGRYLKNDLAWLLGSSKGPVGIARENSTANQPANAAR
jgi:peptidoglycan/LPS O-acetylase OafA/YrhL